METTIEKGWSYIQAIFQVLIDRSKENETLIEPQYIFRGITKRWFSTSTMIEDHMVDIISDIVNANPESPEGQKEWIKQNQVLFLGFENKSPKKKENCQSMLNNYKLNIINFLLNKNYRSYSEIKEWETTDDKDEEKKKESETKIKSAIQEAKENCESYKQDLSSNFYRYLYARFKSRIEYLNQNCSIRVNKKNKSEINAVDLLKTIMPANTGNDIPSDYDYCIPEYINSGAVVRLKEGGSLHPSNLDYVNYIKHMLNDLKILYPEYNGDDFSDIEILADVQHKGGATCLADFSTNFLTSLWFATEALPDDIGFLFCYDINKALIQDDKLFILNKNHVRRRIEDLLYETSKGNNSFRYWLWRPSILNERIKMQDSVFVFGLEPFKIIDNGIIAIPIPPSWKKPIQQVLKMFFGITAESVYCDVEGYADANSKTRPYTKTFIHYFNEHFVKGKIPKHNIKENEDIDEDKDYLQCGMDCLFHGEYELALKYFESYKAKTQDKYKVGNINSMTSNNVINYLLNTDVLYSKGICLKHLGNDYGAIHEFEEAYHTCNEILTKFRDNEEKYYGSKKKLKIYQDYIKSKRSKAFNDLVGMYFATHQYIKALEKLESKIKEIKPVINEDAAESSYENSRHQYWYYLLKIKEAECCKELDTSQEQGDASIATTLDDDLKVLTQPFVKKDQPLLYVLNSFFDCLKVIKSMGTNEKVKAKTIESFRTAREKGYGIINNEKRYIFNNWDLKNIEVLIKKLYSPDNATLYKELREQTDNMNNFIIFIQSKIKSARS